MVEPIQGEGGYVVPEPKFHQRLREITKKHGILLIADEVQSGMGRTGKMFAIEHFGVEPDIVAVAKGVASGLPLGVTTARADVMAWPPGSHASTFGGNPVSCAAALETIELLKSSLMKNAADVGAFMIDRLRELQQKHQIIGDVRGRGLMIGIELVRDRVTKERATTERDKVVDACFKRGLLVLGAGKNAIRISPPLVLTKARPQADDARRLPSRHHVATPGRSALSCRPVVGLELALSDFAASGLVRLPSRTVPRSDPAGATRLGAGNAAHAPNRHARQQQLGHRGRIAWRARSSKGSDTSSSKGVIAPASARSISSPTTPAR